MSIALSAGSFPRLWTSYSFVSSQNDVIPTCERSAEVISLPRVGVYVKVVAPAFFNVPRILIGQTLLSIAL
jgi:hypothetical protein